MEYPGASFDPRFTSASDDYPMTRPLWEIKSIRCKKGVGIVSGSTTAGTTTTAEVEVDAVPPYNVPAWRTYWGKSVPSYWFCSPNGYKCFWK